MTNTELIRMLPADYRRLLRAIAEFDEHYRATLAGTAEASDISSETWHDNPAFDEVQQQAKMSFNQLKKLEAIKKNSSVVSTPPEGPQAAIGSRLLVSWNGDDDIDSVVLTGYMAPGSPEEEVSTASPLGRLLLGATAGSIVHGTLGERTVELTVHEIEPAKDYF